MDSVNPLKTLIFFGLDSINLQIPLLGYLVQHLQPGIKPLTLR